jgi:hypothetical protein
MLGSVLSEKAENVLFFPGYRIKGKRTVVSFRKTFFNYLVFHFVQIIVRKFNGKAITLTMLLLRYLQDDLILMT